MFISAWNREHEPSPTEVYDLMCPMSTHTANNPEIPSATRQTRRAWLRSQLAPILRSALLRPALVNTEGVPDTVKRVDVMIWTAFLKVVKYKGHEWLVSKHPDPPLPRHRHDY